MLQEHNKMAEKILAATFAGAIMVQTRRRSNRKRPADKNRTVLIRSRLCGCDINVIRTCSCWEVCILVKICDSATFAMYYYYSAI